MHAYVLEPHDAAILQAACAILLAANKLSELEPLVHTLLQQFPAHWNACTTAGYTLLRGYGAPKHACAIAARAPELQPRLAQAWFQYGSVLALAGQHGEAIAALEAGWTWRPQEDGYAQSTPAAVWLGESYGALSNVSKAQQWWETAINLAHKLRPCQPAIAHYWEGKAWARLGQTDRAHQALRTALRQHLLYPDRQEAERFLAA